MTKNPWWAWGVDDDDDDDDDDANGSKKHGRPTFTNPSNSVAERQDLLLMQGLQGLANLQWERTTCLCPPASGPKGKKCSNLYSATCATEVFREGLGHFQLW